MQRVERIGWIEWARVLGAMGVVVLHVLTSSFIKVPEEISNARLTGYVVSSVLLGRWAVPSFFMITGYLLLDSGRKMSWAKVWSYTRRMLLVIVTFGLFFALLEEVSLCLNAGKQLSFEIVPAALKDVLTASSWDHLWYVYALIGIYPLVPAVQWAYRRLGTRGFTALTIVLFLLVLVVPTGVRLWQGFYGSGVDLSVTGVKAFLENVPIGLTYLCIGGCLRTWQLRRVLPLVVGALASVSVMICVELTGLFVEDYGDMGFVYLQGSCFACVYAVCVLVALRKIMGDKTIRPDSFVMRCAGDSFGVYVIHPLYVHLVLLKINPVAYPPVLFEVLFVLIVLAVSVMTTRALRHVPLLRTLI